MPMNAADYRESLRRCSPRVFVDGARIASVVDAPALQPGINALGLTTTSRCATSSRRSCARCRRRAARP